MGRGFGQILTGFPVIDLRGVPAGAAGVTLRLRGGNSVAGAGTAASPLVVAEENNFHDANLQTNYYTVGRAPRQTWEPKFSHWGFRDMEIRNLEAVLGREPDLARDAGRFRVKVARSGFERVGRFRTDNPLLQRINSNLEWAQQNNLVGKPTDTPSREKNGWTGDTMADSEAQSLIWRRAPRAREVPAQLPRRHDLHRPAADDPARGQGRLRLRPTPGWNFTWQAVPAWDSAFFVMPWEQYEQYGNTSLFAELYDRPGPAAALLRDAVHPGEQLHAQRVAGGLLRRRARRQQRRHQPAVLHLLRRLHGPRRPDDR